MLTNVNCFSNRKSSVGICSILIVVSPVSSLPSIFSMFS
ncbi:YSIRK-type signal peptide-containing protein [Fluviicola sp.]